jgi:spermidine synthase
MKREKNLFTARKVRDHIWRVGNELWFSDPFEENFIPLHGVKRIVADQKSRFQDILILDTLKFGRVLVLDGFPQMSAQSPIYREVIGGTPIIFHPHPTSALILGGGDGEVLRVMREDKRIKEFVLVDIDGEVIKLTQKHMPGVWRGIPTDIKRGRIKILVADALAYLRDVKKKFSIIVIDLTDPTESALSTPLMHPDFFAAVREHLEPNGIVCMQSGQLTENDFKDHLAVRKLLQREFEPSHIRSLSMHIPWFSTTWSATVASRCPLRYEVRLDISGDYFKNAAAFASKLKFLTPETFKALFALAPNLKKKLKLV